MADTLTCEKVLELIKETNRLSSERLEKESQKRMKEFDEELQKSREEFNEGLRKSREEFNEGLRKSREEFDEEMRKSREKSDEEMRKSRKEFDKKIGDIGGTLGRFVEGLVQPRLLEMFREKGIFLTDILHNVEIHDEMGQKQAEIDLLLINSTYSVAVEVKTTLTKAGVDEHLKRLDTLQKKPKRYVKGTILLGAVAGMVVHQNADRYAYKKGLYVLKQKGEILEIANDEVFKHREWVID